MKTLAQLDLTDYMKIAALVNNKASDEPSTYEVEYEAGGYTLIIEVEHVIEHREEIGGSFEGWDFERISVVDSEGFDVIGFNCYESEGELVACDFCTTKLTDILN